jgi:hypothetical protein
MPEPCQGAARPPAERRTRDSQRTAPCTPVSRSESSKPIMQSKTIPIHMDKVSTASQPSEVKQDRPLRGKPFPHGEAVCTFLLVFLIFVCAAHKATQPFTPLVNPPLFAVLTWLEAPLSGASANPARSFGPELVGWLWQGSWVYWIGPGLGAALAVLCLRLGALDAHRPREARLCHFGHHGATGPNP